ncbi:Hypothetical predicted protein [Xyrichtys novacula]|uniref:Uncharacterized protein n=1 Tax=Xyrichtys novacula TaxID=13765 RepID=A0AAV1FGD9_XYRNO|nr:Hypothetical predicted protein [Xyrichtys novacula]
MASPVKLPAGATENSDVREIRLRFQVLSYAIMDETLDRRAIFHESMACHTFALTTTARMARQLKAAEQRSACLERAMTTQKEEIARLQDTNLTLSKQLEEAQVGLDSMCEAVGFFADEDKAGEGASNVSGLQSIPPVEAADKDLTSADKAIAGGLDVVEEGCTLDENCDSGEVGDMSFFLDPL